MEINVKKKHVNIPIFVSNSGCPNMCSFCNQKKITGQAETMNDEKAELIIEENLKSIDHENTETEIAFFGGSFTGIPIPEQKRLLAVAKKYKDKKLIKGIRLSTRPDYIDENILEMLKDYGVTAIELGAQSMDDEVLRLNDRGHTSKQTEKAASLIKHYGFELGLQMMVGLYGETRTSAIQTAEKIIALLPECVRIYPTLIIKDTKLERLYNEGKYKPLKLDEAVSLCAVLLSMFDEADIKVLRIGLLASDNINLDKDVVAGPFHPSFGELTESEKFFNKVRAILDEKNQPELNIVVNPRFVSIATGNKKKNIKRIMQEFDIKKVKLIQDEKMPFGDFVIR